MTFASLAFAQSVVTTGPGSQPTTRPAGWTPPPRVVVPQIGRAAGTVSSIELTAIKVRVDINGESAATSMELSLSNRSGASQEATLLIPVPAGAAVTGFTFDGPAAEPTARVLGREDARREYESIVARERDPALLEWAGWNLVRSSVFPVPAGGKQTVRVAWEEVLPPHGERLDYVLPRSDLAVGGPAWNIDITVRSPTTLAAVYSPTHELRTVERTDRLAHLVATDRGAAATGALRLSVVRGVGPSATVLTYPDPVAGGGYFLVLAAAPPAHDESTLPRDIVIVLDRSGSMSGAPLEQAKAAAARIVDGLRDGDHVNVIDFSNGISRFASAPVALDPAQRADLGRYIAALKPAGGTNIHDALLEALRQPMTAGAVPLCLFVTDGLPTIGRTLERDIRALAESANPGKRRIFTVGLGPDVNVPLLDRIADTSRATATYVMAGDDLGARIADVAERLSGPVLADPTLVVESPGGGDAARRVAEVQPGILPDLFRGSTLVVLGQYRGDEPFKLAVKGTAIDGTRRLIVDVDPKLASTSNGFVPRLWASRRIAQLVDAVRQLGADAPGGRLPIDTDPRLRELVGEIVRLSTTWGILTEYTSMLALEGSRLNDWRRLEVGCGELLNGRAVGQRSGYEAVNQGINFNRQKEERNLAGTKGYVNGSMQHVESQCLAQCGDRNMWKSGTRWTDATLAGQAAPAVDEEVEFGSERHRQILWELVEEHRQSAIALDGEILLRHHGKNILIRNRAPGC